MVCLYSDKKVVKLTTVITAQPCEHTKDHWTVNLNCWTPYNMTIYVYRERKRELWLKTQLDPAIQTLWYYQFCIKINYFQSHSPSDNSILFIHEKSTSHHHPLFHTTSETLKKKFTHWRKNSDNLQIISLQGNTQMYLASKTNWIWIPLPRKFTIPISLLKLK